MCDTECGWIDTECGWSDTQPFPLVGTGEKGCGGGGGEKYSLCWHPSGALLCVKRALCSHQHFPQEQTTINFGEMINLV